MKNGLEFPDLPPCLKELTALESKCVSPNLAFLQLRDLTPWDLNPQIGIKGSVVNVPINNTEIIRIHPRTNNNMETIQLKLKRRLEHKSNYMFESIRPHMIYEALNHLIPRTVFRENNITVDHSIIMEQYKNTNEPTNFIVNLDDAKVFEEVQAERQKNEKESELKAVDINESSNSNESSPQMSSRKKKCDGPKLRTEIEILGCLISQ